MNTDAFLEELLKLVISFLIGALVGAEREYKNKAAGFRTVTLITTGSTLFTIISMEMGGAKDPARVAANIITGIGFLGAGAIFKEGANVKGLTTAATIWLAAAMGMSVGIGQYQLAALSLVIVLVIQLALPLVQKIIDASNREKTYKITMLGNNLGKMDELNLIFRECKLNAVCINQAKQSNEMILTYVVKGTEKNHHTLITQFYGNSLIESFEA